jgi:hypothetical protein
MLRIQRFRAPLAVALVLVPLRSSAFGVDTGLGLGAVQVGTAGYFSVSPHVGLTLGGPHGPVLTFQNVLMLMPTGRDVGIQNQIVIGAGYEGKRFTVTAGALMVMYRIPTCGPELCGVVMGIGPGGFARLDVLMTDSLGLSARGTMAWYGGQSRVLPGELSWSLAAGPVLRWR